MAIIDRNGEFNKERGYACIELNTYSIQNKVKPFLSGHSNRRSIIGFEDQISLNADNSIAECSKRAFCNTFDLH